jgi:hypothetical protein
MNTNIVPAVDMQPTGHLPHLVEQARPHPDPEQPLTAAQRGGPAWLAEYGCPGDWCDMAHDGDDGNPGWHQGRTVAVTAPTKVFSNPSSSAPESVVLAARINQTTDAADAYGLTTKVWVDVDLEVLELTIPQFRALLAAMRHGLPQWEAMANEAEQLATGDHQGDPEVRARYEAELTAHLKAIKAGDPCDCFRCIAKATAQA